MMLGFLPTWAAIVGLGIASLWAVMVLVERFPVPVTLLLLAAFLAIGT